MMSLALHFGTSSVALESDSTLMPYLGRGTTYFWGICMLLVPLVILFHQYQQAIDWRMVRTTLWVYLAVLFVYLFVHALRTPWKLDAERAETG